MYPVKKLVLLYAADLAAIRVERCTILGGSFKFTVLHTFIVSYMHV